jgi:4-diphosphocytidyl-2-C-methyl-D-erythritol kinase
VVAFPNCKINLGLNIIRKREDGFHDIESVFYPLPLTDAIEVIKAKEGLQFTATGLPVNGTQEENLCIRAYRLLQKNIPDLPGIDMHLHKVIPMGAGLGGGSANAAFMLKLLNDKFHLQLSIEKLLDYSLQLGSDCPFFIVNKPAIATGRGEFLQTIPLDLSDYSFLLYHPGIHINTSWAFSQLGTPVKRKPMQETISRPIEAWKHELVNDFEEPVCNHHPILRTVKEKLYEAGAIYASMTGSGSSYYGIFPKEFQPNTIDLNIPGLAATAAFHYLRIK